MFLSSSCLVSVWFLSSPGNVFSRVAWVHCRLRVDLPSAMQETFGFDRAWLSRGHATHDIRLDPHQGDLSRICLVSVWFLSSPGNAKLGAHVSV